MDGCRRQRSPGDPAPRAARGNQRLVVQRAGLRGQPRQSVRRTGVAADEAAGRHARRLFQAVLGHGRAGRLPRGRVARRRRGNVRAPQPAFRPFASLSGSGRGEVCQRAFPRAAGACLRRTACGRWPRARPGYRPLYEGGPAERDEAYHQGTVWPWLLGAYGEAVLRAAMGRARLGTGAAADHTALVRPAPRRRGDRVRFGNF